MKLILLGAPGAGKGTQAEIISKRLGIPTISTGNILRAAMKNGTPVGLKAKEYVESGRLVPDDVIIGIVEERLAEPDCKGGYILDGMPRTIPQAEALEARGIDIDCALSIEISDETIIERMSGRRTCPGCGAECANQELVKTEYVCPHCGGSGYVGAVMCECLQELCRQEQKKELSSLLSGKENFDGFRLDYYPTEPDPSLGVSPRQLMERTFRRCKRYAREFRLGAPSLLFSGGPGLGKTFLSACIARAVADSGFSVVYDTAGQLFDDFEAVKFGGDQRDLTQKYLNCDLLIVDDLGTEMTTQFTQSVLYRVINDRLLQNRPMIVSTNLSDSALRQRYSPAIASRLTGEFEQLRFFGDDIRAKKRRGTL